MLNERTHSLCEALYEITCCVLLLQVARAVQFEHGQRAFCIEAAQSFEKLHRRTLWEGEYFETVQAFALGRLLQGRHIDTLNVKPGAKQLAMEALEGKVINGRTHRLPALRPRLSRQTF